MKTFLFSLAFLLAPLASFAQTIEDIQPAPQEYFKGVITAVENTTVPSGVGWSQQITVDITDGSAAGTTVNVTYTGISGQDDQRFTTGERVVVTKLDTGVAEEYFITDRYRLNSLLYIGLMFVGLILVFVRQRGVFALVGMALSLLIMTRYIVPNIVDGKDPLVVSIIGATAIAIISLYVAHGIKRRTTLAVVSTLATIVIAVILSYLFVSLADLTGLSSEEAYFVQSSISQYIDLGGLLLGGIIIGVLGILDDITTAQTATVEEIHNANPALPFGELYRRAFSVGREHIISLVNTLVLAYAGASLPLFLLFTLDLQPLWVTLNSEYIAEEIIRTLVGSTALIFAVPLTTVLSAWWITRNSNTKKPLADQTVSKR